jgi:hypothetical protein
MTLQLREIRPLGEARYELTFQDAGGNTKLLVCRVIKHKGISAVRFEPDLVMASEPSPINSRDVAAAVLEYHHRQPESLGPEGQDAS